MMLCESTVTDVCEYIFSVLAPDDPEACAALWDIVTYLLVHTGLPGLKGNSRIDFLEAKEGNVDAESFFFDTYFPLQSREGVQEKAIKPSTHLYELSDNIAWTIRFAMMGQEDAVSDFEAIVKGKGKNNPEILFVWKSMREPAAEVIPITRSEPKIYPNDPCPCGSGKKYKKCCGKKK